MLFIILSCALALFIYIKQVKLYNYWEEKGVPHLKPSYLFGNVAENVFRTKSMEEIVDSSYSEFPNSRYVGMYQFSQPTLIIRDPELIKQITIKDFDTFPEHTNLVSADVDPLWGKNLFAMSNKDGWHDMRATLSPSFTSSKMKSMFGLLQTCSTQFVNYFKQHNGKVTVEVKDAFTRFTNDVIGTSAFGITCDSMKDKDNEFYLMGKDASDFSGIKSLKFFAYSFSPNLMKILNLKMLNRRVSTFFRSVIKETINIRTEQNVIRPDMIHLMLESRKRRQTQALDNSTQEHSIVPKKHELSDEDITAQAMIFFLAGFETVSTAMSFLTYELAINPDVQQKLYEEIIEAQINSQKQVTYDVLSSMKYLDSVVSESLRLHTPATMIDRKSVKPYTIQPKDSTEKPLHLEQGSTIWIPASAIHHDAKYYPNPRKFDPDRFNAENKHKINPFTYLPFGSGPRNCIGSRFALLEIKLIMAQLLLHFQILPDKKTAIPLKIDKTNPFKIPAEGIWVAFNPR